jgi:hypothetical protein
METARNRCSLETRGNGGSSVIKKSDIKTLKVKPSWTKEGVEYALKSWTATFNRMGKPNPYVRLKNIAVGVVAEKAVEESLSNIGTPFDRNGSTRWYQVDRYDIAVKDTQLDVKSFLIDVDSPYHSAKLANAGSHKYEWLMTCHGLVPVDQFNSGASKKRAGKVNKKYVFAFVEGSTPFSSPKQAICHVFWDYAWLKKAEMKDSPDVGQLLVSTTSRERAKSGDKPAVLRIYGTSQPKKLVTEDLKLDSDKLVTTHHFHQVFSVQLIGSQQPLNIKIASKSLGLVESIPGEWGFSLSGRNEEGLLVPDLNGWTSIGIDGASVHVLGQIDDGELRIKGNLIPRFSKSIEQYSETKVDNWGIAIHQIHPLSKI